jgi:hypothetical protein
MSTKSLGPVKPTGTVQSDNVLRHAWMATGAAFGLVAAGMLLVSTFAQGSVLGLVGALLLLDFGVAALILAFIFSIQAMRQNRSVAVAPLFLSAFMTLLRPDRDTRGIRPVLRLERVTERPAFDPVGGTLKVPHIPPVDAPDPFPVSAQIDTVAALAGVKALWPPGIGKTIAGLGYFVSPGARVAFGDVPPSLCALVSSRATAHFDGA